MKDVKNDSIYLHYPDSFALAPESIPNALGGAHNACSRASVLSSLRTLFIQFDPGYGAWWDHDDHLDQASGYNDLLQAFLRDGTRTADDVKESQYPPSPGHSS